MTDVPTPAPHPPVPGRTLGEGLRAATARLAAAGVEAPRVDAELLAAHLLGMGLGQLRTAALRGDPAPDGLSDLVEQRAAGVPVQHLTGRAAFRRIEIAIGPGVFIPRPETELVTGAAIEACRGRSQPVVVDLCTGSGAIACSILDEVPGALVYAIEIDDTAAGYAERNLRSVAGQGVVIVADATLPSMLAELDGTVDVVVCNPPYVPDSAPVSADAQQDPAVALFGGPTGNELPVRLAGRAQTLLRPGGTLVLEHYDTTQRELSEALRDIGFHDVLGHRDLAGRPRFITARGAGADE